MYRVRDVFLFGMRGIIPYSKRKEKKVAPMTATTKAGDWPQPNFCRTKWTNLVWAQLTALAMLRLACHRRLSFVFPTISACFLLWPFFPLAALAEPFG